MTINRPRPEPTDFDANRLRQLAAAQCDECLSDAEARELEAMLAGSAAARTMYVQYMNIHAVLDWDITSRESVEGLVPAACDSFECAPSSSGRRQWRWSLAAMAAGLLIVSAVAVWRGQLRNPDLLPQVAQSDSDQGPVEIAAEITELGLGPQAQWHVTHRNDATPAKLRTGDVVYATLGQVQVKFDCGAVVTLYSPAELEIMSPRKGKAIQGKLAAYVPSGAEGFTIETPQATVVDLGTVFGVEVGDEGETDVVVFKGAVNLHFDSTDTGNLPPDPQRLTSGEAMRIDKLGTASRIIAISSERFANRPDYQAAKIDRPVLISAVTDNIDRQQRNWNYYEIVHGGMREDAKSFVDRDAHEWNGLEASGMPKFLVGGDYVKTFNNDKYAHDLELFVTIDHPCRLLLLIDDRITPPAWLRQQFRDTGFDLGLDVGPFYRVEDGVLVDDRLPGIGPGVSVDDVISIWDRQIDAPQVVHLGAPEASHRYVNMYGIVAVPLGEK